RIEVERARHAGGEARLPPHRQTGLLVRPLNDQPLELGPGRRRVSPLPGAFGVEIQPAKGRVTLPIRAARIARPQLAELEQGADLVPARDLRDLDRLEVAARPFRIDQVAPAGE